MVSPPNRARHATGLTLYAVLLFLLFAGVLSIALHDLVLQVHAQAHLVRRRLAARSLCRSALSAVAASVGEHLARPTSPLQRMDLGDEPITAPTDVTSLAGLDTAFQALSDALSTGASGSAGSLFAHTPVDCRAVLTLHPPGPPGRLTRDRLLPSFGHDPLERRYRLEIALDATVGRRAFAGTSRRLAVAKEVATANLQPGVIGRFTLWAGGLNPSDGSTVQVDFDGNAVNNGPLVLDNEGTARQPQEAGPSTDRLVYRRRGFVYLGGRPRLRLAAGHANLGQMFEFVPVADLVRDTARAPIAFAPRDVPATPFFSEPFGPGPVPQTSVRHRILQMVYGYYTGRDGRGRALTDFLPAEKNALSSGLHLYGSWERPSPTLVLGQVYRDLVIASALVFEVVRRDPSGHWSGDGADGVVALLPERERAAPFPRGLPGLSDPLVCGSRSQFAGKTIPLSPPGMTLARALGADGASPGAYDAVASYVRTEPYNAGYNMMYSADDDTRRADLFAPSSPVLEGFQDRIEVNGPSGQPFFAGPASAIGAEPGASLASILKERAVYRVADGHDLFTVFGSQERGQPRELLLGATVLVAARDPLDLGSLAIGSRGGGTLVIDGPRSCGVTLRGLVSKDDAFGLVLCPLAGDCAIECPAPEPLPVSVIAPAGGLASLGSNALNLTGTVFARTLDLSRLARGGNLRYDRRLDPRGDDRDRLYRAYLSDDETTW